MNLDALIAQTYDQYQSEQAAEQAKEQRAKDAAKQEAINVFRASLEAEIGAEMIAALGINMDVDHVNGKWVATGQWVDEQSGTTWRISSSKGLLTHTGRPADGWLVNAVGPLNDRWFNHTPSSGNTRDAILIGLGTARAKADDIRAKNARAQADRERQRQQDEAERQQASQLRAEQQRVHEEIEALIEEQRIEALSSAWQWPVGKQVTIYVLQYCTGAAFTGENGTEFDYRTVYTTTDQLDEQGYITVYSRPYSSFSEETIRLSMQHHKPTWERLTLSSVEDVPAQILIDDITCVIPGVRESGRYEDNRFVYDDSSRLFRKIASNAIPAQWLRNLVDRA